MLNFAKVFNQNMRDLFIPLFDDQIDIDSVDNPLQYSRQQNYQELLKLICLLATGLLIVFLFLNPHAIKELPTQIQTMLCLTLWGLLLSKNIPYKMRVWALLIIVYASGVSNSWLYGVGENGNVFMVVFVIWALIFFGRRASILALLISSVTVVLIGILHVLGLSNTNPPYLGYRPTISWNLASSITYFVLVGSILVPCIANLTYLNDMFVQINTMRQKQKATSQQLTKSLEREVALSEQVQNTLVQVQELNEIRSNIIKTISHEFRTPLTIIETSSNIIQQYGRRPDQEIPEKYYQLVNEGIVQLSSMLNDIVALERLQDSLQNIKYKSIPFTRLVMGWSMSVESHADQYQRTTITLNVQEQSSEPLFTNRQLLSRILNPLLENALKYSTDETPIRLECEWDGRNLIWTMTDQGIGIPDGEHEHVCGLFYRGSNTSHVSGVGVGLYQASSIVLALNGTMTLASRDDGEGTVVTVVIPAAQSIVEEIVGEETVDEA